VSWGKEKKRIAAADREKRWFSAAVSKGKVQEFQNIPLQATEETNREESECFLFVFVSFPYFLAWAFKGQEESWERGRELLFTKMVLAEW